MHKQKTVKYKGIDLDSYEQVKLELKKRNVSWDGCVLHLSFLKDDGVAIIEVWETQEALDAFKTQKDAVINELGLAQDYEKFDLDLVALCSEECDVFYHTVKPYDAETQEGTLTHIAEKFGTTVDKLVELNEIENPDLIQVGQKLRVK